MADYDVIKKRVYEQLYDSDDDDVMTPSKKSIRGNLEHVMVEAQNDISNSPIALDNLNDLDDNDDPVEAERSLISTTTVTEIKEDNLTLIFQRRILLKLTDLNLHDIQFLVTVKERGEPENHPLLNSIKVLTKLFEKLMEQLAAVFAEPNDNRQFFVCFRDHHFKTGAIPLPRFSVSEDSPNGIGSRMGAVLFHYLQSNKEFKLSSSFSVLVIVYSPHHMNFLDARQQRNGGRGRKPILRFIDKDCFKKPPIGYPGKEDVFKDKCSLVSFILALYLTKDLEMDKGGEPEKCLKIKKMFTATSKKAKIEGGCLIEEEISRLEQQYPDVVSGTLHKFEPLLPILARHYQCQINVYSSLAANLPSFSYPIQYDHRIRQLGLYQHFDIATSLAHVIAIKSLRGFCYAANIYCTACKHCFKGRGYKHLCKSELKKCCFACRRQLQQPDSYINSEMDFCDGDINRQKVPKCLKCNLVPLSLDCRRKHRCFGWKCPHKCQKFFFEGGDTSIEKIRQDHKCYIDKCYQCMTEYPSNTRHQCQILGPKAEVIGVYPQLAFIYSEIFQVNQDDCSACKPKACIAHRSDANAIIPEPVLITVMFEDQERGHFSRMYFCHERLRPFLNIEDEGHHVVICPELLPDEIKQVPLPEKERTVQFGHPRSKKNAKRISTSGVTLPLMDQVIRTIILDERFRFCVLVTLDGESSELVSSFFMQTT
jgi:hypothetical protein